jgi:hypothetical protein
MKYSFFSRGNQRIRVAFSVSGALPRVLTYLCTLLVELIAIGPLMIVWPTTLLAQIPPSVATNDATPPFAHIVVVVEENHSFSEIVGNPQAPYINSLASAGVLLTNYHAVSHPSEPNYFALYAGSTFGVQDDGNYSEPDPTLATILQGNGESFIGYVESGSPQQHNPWESFPEGMSVERNMSTFPANDFSQLPNVSFVIPNLNDDMHDGTVAQADQWLSINIGAYAQWAVAHQSLLMVVWDEDDGTEGNQVPAILYGANIVPGAYNDAYTHYNLLHTLLDASGLSAPRNAALVPAFGNGIFSLTTHALTDTHDFNGDGKSDIAWRDASGDVAIWLMNGAQILQGAAFTGVATNWLIVGQRDFNGDGYADLLWRDTSGDIAMWFMNGTTISSTASIGNVSTVWSVAGTGDFDGDGKGDILWLDKSGNVAIWLMNGSTITSAVGLGNVGASWQVVGTGDFNGDGKTDILWRDSSGNVAIWFMNGTSIEGASNVGNVSTVWSVAATGDFNGDGQADILWRDNSGDLAMWLMQGTEITTAVGLGTISTAWNKVGTGDFNGDGKSDILWEDTSGDHAIWFMNGTTISSAVGLGTVSNVWSIQTQGAE